MARPAYPPARRQDVVERLHGHEVADPYRWLEDPADPDTVEWAQAQDALVASYLDPLPARKAWRERLAELLATGSVGVPAVRGERHFLLRREPHQEHSVVVVAEPSGERVLLDPMALDPSGRTTLDAWVPDLEGRRLAYQLSSGGDEESVLFVLDVATGERVEGPVDRCRYSPVAWLPGGEQFYYVRRLAPGLVPPDEAQYHRRVYLHSVGTDPATDVEIHGAGLDPTNYYDVEVSADGRWLLVSASAGTAPRNDVWLADLAASGPAQPVLRVVQEGVDAQAYAHVAFDGRLYVLTDRDAPRGRVCVADPADPAYERWAELVAEDAVAVVTDLAVLDEDLLVVRTRHACSEVLVHDRAGVLRSTVGLPGPGSVEGVSTRLHGGHEAWLGWTDFATPPGVLRYAAGTVAVAARAPGDVRLPEVSVEQVSCTSRDGATVRMFVLSPADAAGEPRPTVLYGYGGFGVSLSPSYTASALAWVEAGGHWVIALLRGGGEEGEDWHRAGIRERKENAFDDFAACADHLVAGGWTTRDGLGVVGGSNGGLLVGATLTRRPDLCAAAVCSAPLLDMVRYEQFGLGQTWSDEFGSAADPTELGWLLAYSPYHHVRDGVAYPATLFTVFESDTRVDPLHARKMCAALQHATAGDRPVLLRREHDAGHGARAVSRVVEHGADVLTFLADQLGLAR